MLSSLFKIYDKLFVVTWKQKDGEECRVTVACEKSAKVLFANLKQKHDDAQLYVWSSENVIKQLA